MPCRCPPGMHASLAELAHTSADGPAALPGLGGERVLSGESRHCPACGTWWWLLLSEWDQVTYDRVDEMTPIATHHYRSGYALRCRDRVDAADCTAWYPQLHAAAAEVRRHQPPWGRRPPADQTGELAVAYERLRALVARHPGSEDFDCVIELRERVRHWRPSQVLAEELRPRRNELIALLTRTPGDAAAAAELAANQARCAAARAGEAAPDYALLLLDELWHPALAPMQTLEDERRGLLNRHWSKQLDVDGKRRLHAVQRTIEAAWRAFSRAVLWPAPAIEFRFTLDFLCRLEPQHLPDDPRAYDEADGLCLRLRTLMQRHGLQPGSDVVIVDWLAPRLGVPRTRPKPMPLRR